MKNELVQKAQELAARNYSLAVFKDETPDGQPVFLAKNPELYGCMAQGTSLEDAIKNLAEARFDYIYSLLEDSLEVPEPAPQAVITVDTAAPVQFTVEGNIEFGNAKRTSTERADRKSLYEASINIGN